MKTLFLSSVMLSMAARADNALTPVSQPFIARLVHEAVASHPVVAAANARTRAAVAAIGTVRLWEDPQLGLGLTAASRSMRKDNGDIRIAADQMLPRRGLYNAEVRRATAGQQAQQAATQQAANELGLSVAKAVLELALADELISLQTENLTWLQTIVRAAAERAKNPDATAVESLRLQSELAVRIQTLASLRRQRAQFAAQLNLLLGRAPDYRWPALNLPAQAPPLTTATALKARMERGNPQLAALRHQIEGSRAEADAAREKTKPVFTVGVESNTYSGSGVLDGMVSVKMTLPWFNRAAYLADVAKADQLYAAAQSDLAAGQRELYSRLNEFLTDENNHQQLASAYAGEVLPASEKAVETLQTAWVSSKATLLEVLEARRALLDARQEQKRALAARDAAFQSLTALTGGFTSTSSK